MTENDADAESRINRGGEPVRLGEYLLVAIEIIEDRSRKTEDGRGF